MSKAQMCPVCKGRGKIPGHKDMGSTVIENGKTCHGCDGRGWVEVGGDDPPYWTVPYQPWPSYPPYCPPQWTYTCGDTVTSGGTCT